MFKKMNNKVTSCNATTDSEYPSSPIQVRKKGKITNYSSDSNGLSDLLSNYSRRHLQGPSFHDTAYFSPKKPQECDPESPENQTDFMGTAYFDSPQKLFVNKPAISSALPDTSYKEVLNSYRNYKPSRAPHATSHSFQVNHIHDLLQKHSSSSSYSKANRSTIFKPLARLKIPTQSNACSLKITQTNTQHLHNITDMCFYSGNIWSVGLDYRLVCYRPSDLSLVTSKKNHHSRGIIGIEAYKNCLVTASKNGSLKAVANDSQLLLQAHQGGVKAFASMGNYLITGNDSIKLWADFYIVREYQEKCVGLASISGDSFVSCGRNRLSLWDLRTAYAVSEFYGTGPFVKCLNWDEFAFWSVSEDRLQVVAI